MLKLAKLLVSVVVVTLGVFLIGVVALGVSAVIVATVRGDRIDRVCRIGDELVRTRVLDQAQVAYQAVVRASADASCPESESEFEPELGRRIPEGTAAARIADVHTLQRQRDAVIEDARANRAIAGRERDSDVRRQRRWNAYWDYLEGLGVEPYSEGARRGLRFVLRGLYPTPRDAPEARICQRIDELAENGLVAEARVVYVRALDHGGPPQCDPSFASLRNRRQQGVAHLRAARANVRAGDTTAARRDYLLALTEDPSLTGARAGLEALPLPRIVRDRSPQADGWAGIEAAATWIARNVAAIALLLVAALLLAKLVWWGLGKAGDAFAGVKNAMDGVAPLQRLTKEHIEIFTTEPLTGEDAELVKLIREELNKVVGSGAPTRKLLTTAASPFDLINGAVTGGGFAATALAVSPAMGPIGGAVALLPQLMTKRQSRLLVIPRRKPDGTLGVTWWLRDSKGNETDGVTTMADVAGSNRAEKLKGMARHVASQVQKSYP